MKPFLTTAQAAQLLRQGEVVAFPTETVYGLGADATNDTAAEKIFTAKGRPNDNPLIVHIVGAAQLPDVVSEVTPIARKLIDAFWPGALTVILPKHKSLSDGVTAGLQTVGVRVPSHPVALELLREVGLPIAAPSANISGKPSPTTAQHVVDDLHGRIAGIVDGGSCQVGLESTVVDCTAGIPVILRPGGVTREELQNVLGDGVLDVSRTTEGGRPYDVSPRSPGVKYKHYATKAPLVIVGDDIAKIAAQAQRDGKKIGIMQNNTAETLYAILREFDKQDLDVIYCKGVYDEVIMNRLEKASCGTHWGAPPTSSYPENA